MKPCGAAVVASKENSQHETAVGIRNQAAASTDSIGLSQILRKDLYDEPYVFIIQGIQHE